MPRCLPTNPTCLPDLPSIPQRKHATRNTQHVLRFTFYVLRFTLLAVLGLAATPLRPAAATNTSPPRYYAPTGHTLAGVFVPFYDAHGGVPVFGYPIDEAHTEGGYLVQYTERERLEWHPENAGSPYDVLLGRLGADLTGGRRDGAFAPRNSGNGSYFPQTGQSLAGPFLVYWQAHGGVTLFGYPISAEFTENGLRQQWFERARFEWHPELPPDFRVTLGLLGREAADQTKLPPTIVQVSAGPAQPARLQLGLAQGGESPDPNFLGNVVAPLRDLGVPLIRFDNLFNYYHVVQRAPDGTLAYRWDELDTAIDQVRATGAQPYMCLSYTPAALSPDGTPIQPPTSRDDWRALVTATVRHLNADRKLGIRYWEVWNEPDEWGFWRGSWPDYLTLYDDTYKAVRAADPQALVGGPTRSHFDTGGMTWFLDHALQAGTPPDFISWHAYGLPGQTVADQISTMRNLLAARPSLHPELIISEFNVEPAANDTSVEHESDTARGAAYVLSLLDTMDWAGLNRALLFEAKDGPGATAYWGRWGILTNNGQPKPIYYAARAWQALGGSHLPVDTRGPDGVGARIAAPDGRPRGLVWNTGWDQSTRVQILLPPQWTGATYRVTVFDLTHNNPAATGDPTLTLTATRPGTDLTVVLPPGSFLTFEP